MTQRSLDAVEHLADALRELGLQARPLPTSTNSTPELVVDIDGRELHIEVKAASTPSAESVRRYARDARGGWQPLVVVVADRMVASAREAAREENIGWLDLRGHLSLRGGGVLIDADVSGVERRHSSVGDPLATPLRREVAVALLLAPDVPARVRGLARELGRAPSAVSDSLSRLSATGLLNRDGRPVVPDLFWALAASWPTSAVPLVSEPMPVDPVAVSTLQLGLDEQRAAGWALTGSIAAAAQGAPIAVSSAQPKEFFVPSRIALERAVRLVGVASPGERVGATVRVAPVVQACVDRLDPTRMGRSNEHWFMTRPLFVALDLAADPERGREILEDWTPEAGPRLW